MLPDQDLVQVEAIDQVPGAGLGQLWGRSGVGLGQDWNRSGAGLNQVPARPGLGRGRV